MTQATTWSVPLVGPATPTVMAQRMDDSFDALLSGHSGSARPAYAVAGTIWEDTSVANETRIYFYDGAQDILVAVVDTTNDRVELAPQPLVDVASAATTDIGAVKSRNIRVTGTTTITSFGTVRAGTTRTLYFAAALTVTYNATSLITPSGVSLAVAAGDSIDLVSLGAGNWRVIKVVSGAGTSINLSASVATTSGASIDFTGIPSNAKRVTLNLYGVSTNGTSDIIVQLGTSSGVETSGYGGATSRLGTATTASSSTTGSANLTGGDVAAADVYSGKVMIEKVSGNLWTVIGLLSRTNVTTYLSVCSKTTAAALDRIRLTTAGGSNTFDAGTASISWEL